MTKPPSASYPGVTQIKRAISAVVKAGVTVGTIEIAQNGAIRIFSISAGAETAANDFEEWEKRGLL